MAENLRRAFIDKLGKKKNQVLRRIFYFSLDELRENKPYCTIQWEDTKKFEVIEQEYIRLPPAQEPEINVTYNIVIDGVRRHGTVLAAGNSIKMRNHFYVYQRYRQIKLTY